MHYEKKGFKTAYTTSTIQNTVIGVAIFSIILMKLYIHAPFEFWWPIKFIDLINACAQLATAAAFFLAIHQYRKNKESERQKVLIDEARTLIEKMKSVSKTYLIEQNGKLKHVMAFLENMSSHAGNFNAIFKELNEDIHKAIIRMHWQDMYFGELNRAIQSINKSIDLTHFNVSSETNLQALVQAVYIRNQNSNSNPLFSDYIKFQYISNLSRVKKELKVEREDHLTMYIFEQLFLNNSALKDILYGTCNIIEIRLRAPLIAVLNEIYDLEDTGRDKNHYKAFWPSAE